MKQRKRDNNNARWSVQYPMETFLENITDDFQTTGQIEEKVGCSGDLAYLRLTELFNAGKIERVKAKNIWLWKRKKSEINCPDGCVNKDWECENCVAGSHYKEASS